MARREVVEVTCDRCGRVETQASSEAPKGDVENEVSITFHGETHSFEDLCKRCRSAVKGYYERIAKLADDQAKPTNAKVTPLDPASSPAQKPPEKKRFLGGK